MLNIVCSRFIKIPARNRHSLLQKNCEIIHPNKLSVSAMIQTLFITLKKFCCPSIELQLMFMAVYLHDFSKPQFTDNELLTCYTEVVVVSHGERITFYLIKSWKYLLIRRNVQYLFDCKPPLIVSCT